jgi:hypothetical protein
MKGTRGSGHNKYCDKKNCEQKWRREEFCFVSSFFFIIKYLQDVRRVPESIFFNFFSKSRSA